MTAKPRVLGIANYRIAPLNTIVDLKAKMKLRKPNRGADHASNTSAAEVKKPLDKEQIAPPEVFRERAYADLEEMWTLKRANPIFDNDSDSGDELESPTKRPREIAIDVFDVRDDNDEEGLRSNKTAISLAWENRVAADDIGYSLSILE